jgi:hypothetical protein
VGPERHRPGEHDPRGKSAIVRFQLRGADLAGADLTGASLIGARLFEATLTGADLSRADLSAAAMNQTHFGFTILAEVAGLDSCFHTGPSIIDFGTLKRSGPLTIVGAVLISPL